MTNLKRPVSLKASDYSTRRHGGTLGEVVDELEKEYGCNCDLDNWEPEASTGHSHVCRIHKLATYAMNNRRDI